MNTRRYVEVNGHRPDPRHVTAMLNALSQSLDDLASHCLSALLQVTDRLFLLDRHSDSVLMLLARLQEQHLRPPSSSRRKRTSPHPLSYHSGQQYSIARRAACLRSPLNRHPLADKDFALKFSGVCFCQIWPV